MARIIRASVVIALSIVVTCPDRSAHGQEANAIFDKAIKALGGEEKLSKITAASWKIKGTINFDGNAIEYTSETIVQGLDRLRTTLEGEFMGNKFMAVTVFNGAKGWREFAGMRMDLDASGLANEKRSAYLAQAPISILPLKGNGFKVSTIGEETIGGKPAVGLKVVGPDGKDFTIHFDKESGLPVRQVAKVVGFMGDEYTQETSFLNYKDLGVIKKATRIENKRDGQRFIEQEITEFKVLDKVDPKTFE